MNGMSCGRFAVFHSGTLLGSVAIAPYSMRLIRLPGRSVSAGRFVMTSLAPNAALFCAVIAVGLAVARATGLGADGPVSSVSLTPRQAIMPCEVINKQASWMMSLGRCYPRYQCVRCYCSLFVL